MPRRRLPLVSLNEVVQEFVLASTGVQVVLDLTDGSLFPLFEENPDLVPEDFHARDERGDFLFLPDVHDIDEAEWMRRFVDSRDDRDHADGLRWAIRGRGAQRCFLDTARRLGVIEEWYACRDRALAELAVEWLDEHEIPYRRDLAPWGRLRAV